MKTESIHEIESVEEFMKITEQEGNKIVAFLAKCITPSRKYEEILKNFLEGDNSIQIYVIYAENAKELCIRENVKSFPLTRFYKNNSYTTVLGVLNEREIESHIY